MGRFHVVEDLSPHKSLTPEGYLLCRDVAIARTGSQLYACTEVPIEPTPSGIITVYRDADQVFRAETITSFEGKPVTMRHPDEKVGPENWQDVAVGTVQNVRRGAGIQDDYLFADLLVTHADAIAAVQSDALAQISCGYDAQYEQLEPGVGRQLNIIGNHVALVERGRAGPRCAIKDEDIIPMTKATTKTPARSWWDRMTEAITAKDHAKAAALVKDADAPKEGDEDEDADGKEAKATADQALALVKATVDGLPKMIADAIKATRDADEPPDDGKKKPTDDDILEAEKAEKFDGGTTTGDALPALMAKAEILNPGQATPTVDAKSGGVRPGAVMRTALKAAMQDPVRAALIAPVMAGSGVDLTTSTFDTLRPAFHAAAALVAAGNNARNAPGARTNVTTRDFGKAETPNAINKRNAEFWNRKPAA